MYRCYIKRYRETRKNLTKILIRCSIRPPTEEWTEISYRYEKKTIFDIMGVVYEYNGFGKQKKAA